MTFFPDFKTFVQIGDFSVGWYGLLVVTGALTCYYLSARTLKKYGYSSTVLEDFFITLLPVAFIGARIWYVLFELDRYKANPISIFYVWEGGLAIHGGVIAGALYGLWFFRKRAMDGLRIADAIFPNLLIAQFIGRWGNFFNQEAYGGVVTEAFYNGWPSFIKDHMYIDGAYRQPTFLFEGIGNLIGFILITFVFKKYGRKKRGDLAFAYLTWYGLVRFFVEGLRTDSLMFGSIRVAQLISIIGMLIGIFGLVGVWDKVFKNFYPFKKVKPVVLFDLDGTLLDTEGLIKASFIHTFNKFRPEISLDDETLKSFIGPTLHQTFARYSEDETEIQAMMEYYRSFNYEQHDELVSLIDGAKELVIDLKDKGYDLGVVSNKNHLMVEHGLKFFGIFECFESIVAVDDVEKPKPDPEGLLKACKEMYRGFDNIVYVGDHYIDVITAKNIGAFSIAYVTDETKTTLEKAKPCRVIKSLSEVKSILSENLEWSDPTIL